MLETLSISNYVIIEEAEISFTPDLNMITGETGAGKSIILGALGLVLGRRADMQVLMNPDAKAIVEAIFSSDDPAISALLQVHDLDEGPHVVVRREITPNGRSRAFINDSPVTLDTMSEVGAALIDIHQQFETLDIQSSREQYRILDAFCSSELQRQNYSKDFSHYTALQSRLDGLKTAQANAIKEKDYLSFQLGEFDSLQLERGGINAMEEEFKLQADAEEIKAALSGIAEALTGERGIAELLRPQLRSLMKLAQGSSHLTGLTQSIQGLIDQCRELSADIEHFEETIEPNPQRREQLEEKLNVINRIMLKHGVKDEEELMRVRADIQDRMTQFTNLDKEISACMEEMKSLFTSMEAQAKKLSAARRKGAPKLGELVSQGLHDLAMKHAILQIDITDSNELHSYGKDTVEFLFAANLGSEPRPIKKVASGGELSRLSLCLKSVVSDRIALPTLVFDEIDAGISGEVALRMGQKLKTLARDHQVIMITHSPQIAAQAAHHLQVIKSETGGRSLAYIRTLPPEDRITEIAKMLSGDPPTNAAILNAKTLIAT